METVNQALLGRLRAETARVEVLMQRADPCNSPVHLDRTSGDLLDGIRPLLNLTRRMRSWPR